MADGHSRLRTAGREVLPFIGIGSFARHAVVGARMLVPVPAAQADPALALLACGVVTGVGAVLNVAGVQAGQSVLVVGCGGVGLNVVQGAVLAGAARIVAADTVAAKLELARALGATDVLLPGGDLAAQVAELVPGGVDHAFDVTGAPGVAAAAMAATRPGGGTVLVGSPPADRPLEIPPALLQGGRTLRGCIGGDASPGRDLPMLLDLVAAGRLVLEPLVSERVGLDDVNGAIRRQRAGEVARSLLVIG
jgi:Zn-dependent alcohol dehydrogenase